MTEPLRTDFPQRAAATGEGNGGSPLSVYGSETPLRVDRAVDMYLDYQRRRGRREATVRHTRLVLSPFCRWAGEERLIAEITRRDVELDFLREWSSAFELRRGHQPSLSYVRGLLLSIRGLFAFADEFDLLVGRDGNSVRNPLRHLEVPAASVHGIAALLPAADTKFMATAKTPRERVISQLLRWTGVRLSEAVSLLDEDVDLDQREVRVRRSKTPRGVRTIPLLSQLEAPVEEWRAYCGQRGMHAPGGTFLVTRTGTPMCSRYVWKAVRTIAARGAVTLPGGGNVTPHSLRRTFATDLLNRGVRLEVISRILGHSSTAVAERHYAHLGDERLRAEVEAAFAAPHVSSAPAVTHLDSVEIDNLVRQLAELALQLQRD